MKLIFRLITIIVFIQNVVFAQPKVCITPPFPYGQGGDFDITVEQSSSLVVDNYLCISEKVAVERIGVVNKSNFDNNTIRYLFAIDNATIIPSNIPLSTSIFVDGQSAGEFWIMQIGEVGGQKKLNCKKIQIDVSDRPKVELTSCDNQKVTLKLETNNPISYYTINWGDGKSPEKIGYQNTTLAVPHSYTTSPIDKIEVMAVYENKTLNRTCNSVPIKLTPPSIFHISSLEIMDFGNQMSAILEIKNPNNEKLDILVSTDGGIIFKPIISSSLSNVFLSGLTKTETCFKVKFKNNNSCVYESPAVCSINPKTDNSQYGQIELNWKAVGNQTTYEINRTGGTLLNTQRLKTVNYIDKELDCSGNYNYQVSGLYKDINGNDTKTISSFVRGNANFSSNLPIKQALTASIRADGKPELEILDATGSPVYAIYRSIDGKPFSLIAQVKENTYIDDGNANVSKYCYYVSYIDACNNLSKPSPKACTMQLSGQNGTLIWNSPTELSTATITYELISIDPISSVSIQPTTTFKVLNPTKKEQQFQVIATISYNISGKTYQSKSISNIFILTFDTKIYFSNAFSPNNDGINDVFEIKAEKTNIKEFKLLVYNRWGNIIFESDDIDISWNGSIGNQSENTDLYIIKIYYKDTFGFEYYLTKELFRLK